MQPSAERPDPDGVIDRASPIPLYHQLEYLLRDDIARGRYPAGSLLPSEGEICSRYDVSRSVVRQTLTNLAHAGLIRTERGRGSFVSERKVQERFVQRAVGLFADLQRMGYEIRTKVLHQERTELPLPVQEHLGTHEGVRIDRLRSVDGRVLTFVRSYLVADRFDDLLDEDLEDRSLYEVIERRHGLRPTRGSRSVEAVAATPEIAEHLEVTTGDPLLFLRGTSRDQQGRPLEWFEAWHRGDRTAFEIEILPTDAEPRTNSVLIDHPHSAPVSERPDSSAAHDPASTDQDDHVTAATVDLARLVAASGVVAAVRAPRIARPAELASTLSERGFSTIAVELDAADAFDAIAAAASTDAVVGARGVTDAAGARDAVAAGAAFLVAPFDARDEVLRAAGSTTVVLAALSPSEVSGAWRATRSPVEVFPASMGGAPYLRTLHDAMPNIPLMPAGGIGHDDLAAFLDAGALGVTVGSALCPADSVERGDLGEIATRASALRAILDTRGGH